MAYDLKTDGVALSGRRRPRFGEFVGHNPPGSEIPADSPYALRDPAEAAKAVLEDAKDRFQRCPDSAPFLFMETPAGTMLIIGDVGMSFTKVAAWISTWAKKTGADRYTVTMPTWMSDEAGGAVMVNPMKRRTVLITAVDDREKGLAIAWAEVIGDPEQGRVLGFLDGPSELDKLQRWLLTGLLPKKLEAPKRRR